MSTDKHSLYSCGSNSHGQLLLPHTDDTDTFAYSPLFTEYNLKQVYVGGTYGVGRTNNDAYYTWGNKLATSLYGSDTHSKPTLLATQGTDLTVRCGWTHVVMLDTDNAAITLYGHTTVNTVQPVSLPEFLGRATTVCVTYTQLYVHGDDECDEETLTVCRLDDAGEWTVIQLPELEEGVKQMHAGFDTVYVSDDRFVYGVGGNKHGQLPGCTDKKSKILVAVVIPLEDDDETIVKLACGWSHVLLLTSYGRLVVWGRNDFGQCGFCNGKPTVSAPTEVRLILGSGELIREVVCGSEHSMVLTNRNNVFVTGWNEHGNLGLGHHNNVYTWTLMPTDAWLDQPIHSIAAAGAASYVIVPENG